jgi:membrane protease YdiL (CAAX protease family)
MDATPDGHIRTGGRSGAGHLAGRFVFAWMRLESGSLWTGVFLHASHNLFIQSILTPLTIDTGNTKWAIDEFGFALPITAMVAAVIVWRMRAQVILRSGPLIPFTSVSKSLISSG